MDEKQILANTLIFLGRAQISGSEAAALMASHLYIEDKLRKLSGVKEPAKSNGKKAVERTPRK